MTDELQQAVEKQISTMTMEHVVGQLIVTGFHGFVVPQQLRTLIEQRCIAGVILFKRNLFDRDQTAELCRELQEIAQQAGYETPLLVMIDQEGGAVTRYDFDLALPSAMALGAADSPSYAYLTGLLCGRQLHSMGINVNIAPVLDLLTEPKNACIGTRSFGDDPARVSKLAVRYVEGLQSGGVTAVAKHFPGLGSAASDTHLGAASIDRTLEAMKESDLIPFRRAFEQGVPMVMTNHSHYPRLSLGDPMPASLSPGIVTNLLRGEMHFQGAAITDDLEMGAISKRFGPEGAALKALQAGNDLLLFCHSLDEIRKVHDAILDAMKRDGKLAERVMEAVTRVLWLKSDMQQRASAPSGVEQTDEEMDELLAFEIAQNATCIVRDETESIPIDEGARVLVVHPDLAGRLNVPPPANYVSVFDAMLDYFDDVSEVRYSLKGPEEGEIAEAIEKCRVADVVVLCTLNATAHPGQTELAEKLLETDASPVLVAMDSPFDVSALGGYRTALATFGFREPSARALASILSGDSEACGAMPVKTVS